MHTISCESFSRKNRDPFNLFWVGYILCKCEMVFDQRIAKIFIFYLVNFDYFLVRNDYPLVSFNYSINHLQLTTKN